MVTTDCAHLVQFYDSDDGLGTTVSGFLAVPLLRGDAAVVIASIAHREVIAAQLSLTGIDVDTLRSTGRYVELDAAGTLAALMGQDGPDEQRFLDHVGTTVVEAVRRFGALTAYGEMVGLLAAEGRLVAALQLEQLWSRLMNDTRFRLLCGYPDHTLEADVARQSVCAAHDAVTETAALSAAIDLPVGPEAASLARHAAISVCQAWGVTDLAWIDDAGLVVAELVGNAIRHASSSLALGLDVHGNRITVSVTDGSAALPVPRERDELAEGGRGVAIIHALCDRWGVERHPGAKRVWAQLRPVDRQPRLHGQTRSGRG
jgi:anti-sigma regulatory factor (Ser/Thr protein kinase)